MNLPMEISYNVESSINPMRAKGQAESSSRRFSVVLQGCVFRGLLLLGVEPFQCRSDSLDFGGECRENALRIVQLLRAPEPLQFQCEVERLRGGERGHGTFQGVCGADNRIRILAFDSILNR